MGLRLEMLQVARLAPKLLGDSSELVRQFLRSQQHSAGGFVDREGTPDLYYTVFGLDGLTALQAPLPIETVKPYLQTFAGGGGLDFVHLCCLARAWAAVGGQATAMNPGVRRDLLHRLEEFRAADGGYHAKPGHLHGTAYGAFLALGAYQDLLAPVPDSARLADSLHALATPDGAWGNERIGAGVDRDPPSPGHSGLAAGSTNATAAVVAVLRQLDQPVPESAKSWLLARFHPQGGFVAAPATPMPDLLSTATALHALAALGVPWSGIREPCLDFVDSLWTNAGAFHGHWTDAALDCEYTFYGLLALGYLSF